MMLLVDSKCWNKQSELLPQCPQLPLNQPSLAICLLLQFIRIYSHIHSKLGLPFGKEPENTWWRFGEQKIATLHSKDAWTKKDATRAMSLHIASDMIRVPTVSQCDPPIARGIFESISGEVSLYLRRFTLPRSQQCSLQGHLYSRLRSMKLSAESQVSWTATWRVPCIPWHRAIQALDPHGLEMVKNFRSSGEKSSIPIAYQPHPMKCDLGASGRLWAVLRFILKVTWANIHHKETQHLYHCQIQEPRLRDVSTVSYHILSYLMFHSFILICIYPSRFTSFRNNSQIDSQKLQHWDGKCITKNRYIWYFYI